MIERTTRMRWRRLFKKRRRQMEDIGVQAEAQVDRLFFRRLNKFIDVRRFVISWVLLFVLLGGGVVAQLRGLQDSYLELAPVAGGTMTEGIVGTYTNGNPLYATDPVDVAVAEIVFSGLFKYDRDNKLAPDLAEKYEVDASELVYTVTLKEGVRWHDGTPFTSQDVVFTYETIQNPDTKSPLLSSWRGVKVTALDTRTVKFTLANSLSSFPYSLTNGIVPQHLLKDITAEQLRSVRFNTIGLIGTGPFKLEQVEVSGLSNEVRSERIVLESNASYFAGAPQLQRYVIKSYKTQAQLAEAMSNQEVQAAAGLSSIPDELQGVERLQEYNIPLTGQVMIFFKNSNEILQDVKVRQALVRAVNQQDIISGLGYPVRQSNAPLLKSHTGYDPALAQAATDVEAAKKLLDEAGWIQADGGVRKKENIPLQFKLYAQNRSEYAYVTQVLQKQWLAVGAKVDVMLQQDGDLQTTVANHGYDALLYGISLGVDPDVYAYWHSSQGDVRSLNRLNLSEYKSTVADKALEAGRSRSDPALRAVKYKPFLEAWRNDAPAMALYQPRFLYVVRSQIHGFSPEELNLATDRYANVHEWKVRLGKVQK